MCKRRTAMNHLRPLSIAALTAALAVTATACNDDDNAATATTEAAPPTSLPCADEPTEESAEDLLVGLAEAAATDAAESCGWLVRVVRRDGEDLPMTLDFRPNRVNVEVTDGEITAIISIG
jgi:hypothetical protein